MRLCDRCSKIIKDPCADVNRATGTVANEIPQKYAQKRFPGVSPYSAHSNFYFIDLEV